MKIVDICVATYKRPEMLFRLLESLLCIRDFDDLVSTIIVVDNDATKSANETVNLFIDKYADINLIYDCQPIQNIAITRNLGVGYSKSEYIVFVDDDEYVSPSWLFEMVKAAGQFNADVVFGPVKSDLPKYTPNWIVQGGFFNKAIHPNGVELKHGSTSNTLVRRAALLEFSGPFNEDFGLTGGSDTELFYRMHKAGLKLIFCDSAWVYEEISEDRLSLKWLIRRYFRAGQCYARIIDADEVGVKYMLRKAQRLIYFFICLFCVPLSLMSGNKARSAKFLCMSAGNLGRLMFSERFRYQEYRKLSKAR